MGKSAISELLVTGAALAWSAELEEDKTQWVEACVYIYTIFIGKPFIHVYIHTILSSRHLYIYSSLIPRISSILIPEPTLSRG